MKSNSTPKTNRKPKGSKSTSRIVRYTSPGPTREQLLPLAEKVKLARANATPDEEIDTTDIPVLPPEAWVTARRGLYRPIKMPVNLRVDADVMEWLKSQGPGHLTRINEILRETMLRSLQAKAR